MHEKNITKNSSQHYNFEFLIEDNRKVKTVATEGLLSPVIPFTATTKNSYGLQAEKHYVEATKTK